MQMPLGRFEYVFKFHFNLQAVKFQLLWLKARASWPPICSYSFLWMCGWVSIHLPARNIWAFHVPWSFEPHCSPPFKRSPLELRFETQFEAQFGPRFELQTEPCLHVCCRTSGLRNQAGSGRPLKPVCEAVQRKWDFKCAAIGKISIPIKSIPFTLVQMEQPNLTQNTNIANKSKLLNNFINKHRNT